MLLQPLADVPGVSSLSIDIRHEVIAKYNLNLPRWELNEFKLPDLSRGFIHSVPEHHCKCESGRYLLGQQQAQ